MGYDDWRTRAPELGSVGDEDPDYAVNVAVRCRCGRLASQVKDGVATCRGCREGSLSMADLEYDTRIWLLGEAARHEQQVRDSVSRPEAHKHALEAREEFWRNYGSSLRAGRLVVARQAS